MILYKTKGDRMNDEKRYELIINTSVKAMQGMCIGAILILAIIICINKIYNLNKIWNVCFLVPMYSIYFASVIQNILCFLNINSKNITKTCIRKSRLFFSTCITYLVFLTIFFMYILLSLILFN